MNKRPHPGLGLPAKPYTPTQPGPAPPLPAGPPPQQQQQQQQYTPDQQAAHAAAWAAYYQAQGANAGGAYASAPSGGSNTPAANPYANYGYGGGATHAQNNQPQQPQQQQPQQPYAQQQGYAAPYQPPPHGGGGGYAAPMQGQQQPSYGGAPGYSPPAPRPPAYNNSGYNGGQASPQQSYGYAGGQQQGGGNQPYYPQSNAPGYNPPAASPTTPSQPYRGPGGPPTGGQQNRPYTPQPGPTGRGGMPPRPPAGPSGPGGGFPPAKRPRFDGPGQPGATPPRPPANRAPQTYGSGMARPMGSTGGGRGGAPMGGGAGHGGGGGTAIPRIGFGSSRGGGPMRGGMGGRGGGPMRGGMMRGPPMRHGRERDHRDRGDHRDRDRERERDQRERERDRMARARAGETQARDRKRKDKTEKDARTTMTDFRIVGIEVKELAWTWGLIGEHALDKEDDKPEEEENAKAEKKVETEVEEGKDEPPASTDDTAAATAEVKAEPTEEATDAVDEKRGEKRKAKPSSVDGDTECQSPKKRSTFAVTHGKANDGAAPTSSPESNQNRFRIYFESPPELDRVPKSARRNPNKRWRRESSSVAPSRIGELEAHEEEHHDEHDDHPHAEETHEENEHEAEVKEEAAEATEPTAEAAAEPPAPAPEAEKAETAAEAAEASAPDAPAEANVKDEPEVKKDEGAANGTAEAAGEDVGDVSMVTAPGDDADADADTEPPSGLTGTEASQAELETALAASAANTASAYGSRAKPRTRRWSNCSDASEAETVAGHAGDVAHPSVNRVSVLYEDSSRRLVFDASVVNQIRIFRAEGRIEVDVLPTAVAPPTVPKVEKEEKEAVADDENKDEAEPKEEPTEETKEETKEEPVLELPKGVLVETYDAAEQRFTPVSREKLDQLWVAETDKSLPPLHRVFTAATPSDPITLTVFLNKKKPLSEPKWCRTNQADEWLYEQFGRRAGSDGGWRGKLKIMDPDAPPTLASILEQWKSNSSGGTPADRTEFTASLLASPNDLLEILLRLTRGDRNHTASIGTGPSSAFGPLATAIRPDSPYASHQTHVSLAILAMYRLTTDFAHQAGVKSEVLNEKIADIIKSLPQQMIHKSLDGLYKEWLAERKQ